MRVANLFTDATAPLQGERFESLLSCRNVVIERIVSSVELTPAECVQPQDEWVVLLRGDATLEVAGETIELHPGDHMFLPSGTPHTVVRTSEGALWLAVHVH
jgi:cupin 2 domain-containing protein